MEIGGENHIKMRQVKYTIITVCYNAERFIENTIRSVLMQDYGQYEYVIQDGGSSDATMEIVKTLLEGNDKARIFSRKDKGIYDAMNQAVQHAEGEYILFLNAGDAFCDKAVLGKVTDYILSQKADLFFGNIVQIDGENRNIRKYGCMYKSKLMFLTGDSICHQAIFAKREMFERLFDISYRVCADREWQLYWLSRKANFKAIPVEISNVLVNGFSTAHLSEYEEEARKCIVKYFPKLYWIYLTVERLKRNKITLFFFRTVENLLWKKE